jgi:hypothetical protein
VNAGGNYLDSAGNDVGWWNCYYNGGDYPDASGPVIQQKVTASSVTLSTGVTLKCSAYKYQDWTGHDYNNPPELVELDCIGG